MFSKVAFDLPGTFILIYATVRPKDTHSFEYYYLQKFLSNKIVKISSYW